MKITIFGAKGFIGHYLVKELEEHELVLVSRASKKGYNQVDLKNKEEVDRIVKGSELVIHLASSSYNDCVNDSEKSIDNIVDSVNIMEACVKNNARIVFTSTAMVGGIVENKKFSEDDPCFPVDPYAISKYCVERYLYYYHKTKGLDCMVLRLFNVYGKRFDSKNEVVQLFVNKAKNNEDITVFGDSAKDFVYVGDVVNTIKKVVEKKGFEIINVGSGKLTSLDELVRIIGNEKELKVTHKPTRQNEVFNYCADITRLEELGISPIRIEEGIKEVLK